MQNLISNEREKIAAEYGINGKSLKASIKLYIRLLNLGINYLKSRWYFRKAKSIDGLLFTKRKPDLEIRGELRMGSLNRVWSSVNRCRLSVQRGGKLTIGNNCRLNGPVIAVTNEVSIGNNCRIAPWVYIMDGDYHNVSDRLKDGKSKPVIIEDDAWLATRSMVLKGVTIGKGAVVAAGSVVTKDVPPYTMVAGVPAKFVKSITPPAENKSIIKKINRA